jgi:NADP-reducing hydrogenase subunit HndB
MPKLKPEDLEKITDRMKKMRVLREGTARARVVMHMGTCGIAAGSRNVMNALLAELEEKDIKDVIVTTSGCAGLCSREPMATVEIMEAPPVKYVDLNAEKIKRILSEHVLGGKIVIEYALGLGSERMP